MNTSKLGVLALLGGVGLAALVLLAGFASDRLSETDPEFALLLNRFNSAAHAAAANARLRQQPANLTNARLAAEHALASDPLNQAALLLLAQIAQAEGHDARARTLMLRVAATASRNLRAQAWLLERELSALDWPSTMSRVDAIFRGQDVMVRDALAEILAPILTESPIRQDLVDTLAKIPAWRGRLVPQIVQHAKDLDGLISLYAALANTLAPPTLSELRPFLERLVRQGRAGEAYVAWIRSLPEDRLAAMELLYNASFQWPPTNTPFDWTITPVDGAVTRQAEDPERRGYNVLTVDFFGGRVPFQHVAHDLLLPPGKYRFSGEQQAESLHNERGLRWRLACLPDQKDVLAQTLPLKGDTPWRPFEVKFEVTEACTAQRLVLELPARVLIEQEISGGARYRNLKVGRL